MNEWSPERYAANAAFVPQMGELVLDWLQPRPGERILDLGCGDGALTLRLIEAGCQVVGVDSSPAMVAAAVDRGIDARITPGEDLTFHREFDAVFSNAALHWMKRADAVIAGVARALRPGGRFVGEFGGFGNVAAIVVALHSVLRRYGIDAGAVNPWYFPTPAEYGAKLQSGGFDVVRIELIPRPTPLPTGMTGWLHTFALPFLAALPPHQRSTAAHEAVDLLRPALCDSGGGWIADYVRLRFAAVLRAPAVSASR